MGQTKIVVLKLPKGTPPPAGYKYIRSIRSGDIYHKIIQNITATDMDELTNLFGNNVSFIVADESAVAQADAALEIETTLAGKFSKMTIGGKRRKSRSTRKHRKTRKHRRKSRRYR